jgi:hypothetical protein
MGRDMKAFITSRRESTVELCVWSLERLGFEVELLSTNTTLWQKLYDISQIVDDDYVRVDADVIVNRNVLKLIEQKKLWWYQSEIFDWYKQDVGHGGIQFIRKQALPAIREHIEEAMHENRPETYLSRLEEFHNPRRFGTFEQVCGVHGWNQDIADIERAKAVKASRRQSGFDWELAEKMR